MKIIQKHLFRLVTGKLLMWNAIITFPREICKPVPFHSLWYAKYTQWTGKVFRIFLVLCDCVDLGRGEWIWMQYYVFPLDVPWIAKRGKMSFYIDVSLCHIKCWVCCEMLSHKGVRLLPLWRKKQSFCLSNLLYSYATASQIQKFQNFLVFEMLNFPEEQRPFEIAAKLLRIS